MSKGTLYFIVVLITFGMGAAGVFVYWRLSDTSLHDYYVVADSFTDTTSSVKVQVNFVRVVDYDSLKILRVAELLTRDAIERSTLNNAKEREFLFHFFVPGDTALLTQAMTEELAYTHPDVYSPMEKLLSVPGGWVVRATFAPSMIQPRQVEAKRSAFYMPRHGIRARDLR